MDNRIIIHTETRNQWDKVTSHYKLKWDSKDSWSFLGHYNYSNEIPRYNEAQKAIEGRYRNDRSFNIFTSLPDAQRFAKAQMMKNLFALIDSAKNKIEQIKEFRSQHFELLNHVWTEDKIQELELELNQ